MAYHIFSDGRCRFSGSRFSHDSSIGSIQNMRHCLRISLAVLLAQLPCPSVDLSRSWSVRHILDDFCAIFPPQRTPVRIAPALRVFPAVTRLAVYRWLQIVIPAITFDAVATIGFSIITSGKGNNLTPNEHIYPEHVTKEDAKGTYSFGAHLVSSLPPRRISLKSSVTLPQKSALRIILRRRRQHQKQVRHSRPMSSPHSRPFTATTQTNTP